VSPDAERTGAKLSGGAIASLVGVVALLVFMLQNRNDATFNFLWIEFTWPLWLVVLGSALLGALVWFGVGVMRRHSRRQERRAKR
jgi:uncharacterized integral membrane protein